MSALKINSFILLSFLLFSGCASSTYQVLNQIENATELSVSPDRVLLECEWLYDADIKGLYGFMIHVLDNENTVLTVVQGNTLGKSDCDRRIKKISSILKKGSHIYIAGTGDLTEPRIEGHTYIFPRKGTFKGNSRVLGFVAIANEFGTCYDAYSGDEKPCPRDPFPLKTKSSN